MKLSVPVTTHVDVDLLESDIITLDFMLCKGFWKNRAGGEHPVAAIKWASKRFNLGLLTAKSLVETYDSKD